MLKTTLDQIHHELTPFKAKLVAVSKTYPNEIILEAYNVGQHDFGENRVQELVEKAAQLPEDIRWHFIGHLQTNKVKLIAPFVHLIHAVDSWKLLKEIEKRAKSNARSIDVLLQFKIAEEDTKYGYDAQSIFDMLALGDWKTLEHVRITGVMGMATYTSDTSQIEREFASLKSYFNRLKTAYFSDKSYFKDISMGMSGDYPIALNQGSTMVRIGSKIFGKRS